MNHLDTFLQVFIIIIGLYLAFFKSYFSEKGKQVALKEDIEEITEKVENVKNSYSKELEQLKSQLQIEIKNKHNLNENKLNYILEYYSSYIVWKTAVFSIDAEDLAEDKRFNEKDRIVEAFYFDFSKISAKLELFFENVEFYEADSAVKVSIIKLKAELISRYMAECRVNNYRDKNRVEDILFASRRLSEIELEIADVKIKYVKEISNPERKLLRILQDFINNI